MHHSPAGHSPAMATASSRVLRPERLTRTASLRQGNYNNLQNFVDFSFNLDVSKNFAPQVVLHRYAFSNFQSFAEPTEVSLQLNMKASPRGWTVESPTGQRLSTVLAAVGPNGAGKTALLKPAVFAAWFMAHSFRLEPDATIPVRPHFSAADAPILLEVDADDAQGVLWRYILHLTPRRVLHEALYRKKERFNYIFVRDWNDADETYVIKQQEFGFASSEAKKVRQNASLISTAAQYGVELAARLARAHVSTNINVSGRMHANDFALFRAAQLFAENEELCKQMTRLLAAWDLGLSDVRLQETPITPSQGEARKVWAPFGVHTLTSGITHELPFPEESSGTQTAFVLLSRLLPTLAEGGLAIIDEFENDLHPHMLEPILDLFANPLTNPHRAQLLFTCHAAEVLNLLHKTQVMLVEKRDCSSNAWRLDSVGGVRNDDNFYAKYMAGAYGGVPIV